MKASAKAEYACLTLAELAVRHQRKQPTSLKLLADQYRISHPFLMQIFLQLKGARLVHSTRGSTGGYQLSRPPEDIPLRAIVDAIDGPASETSAPDALPDSPLVLFRQNVNTACGEADAGVGPFYCPGDEKVYIDLSFYDELERKLNAPGDFAKAYVIAHEIGHHVQKQIGDDTLQKKFRGTVQPGTFTHGSSARRQKWFMEGYRTGNLKEAEQLFKLPYDQL